jgi:hypothetical protein
MAELFKPSDAEFTALVEKLANLRSKYRELRDQYADAPTVRAQVELVLEMDKLRVEMQEPQRKLLKWVPEWLTPQNARRPS